MINQETTEPWYSARCIFRHAVSEERLDVSSSLFEERVILIRADDFDQAMRRAIDEGIAYASSGIDVEFLECVDVFHLFDRKVGDLTEVFSLLRFTELNARDYISSFFRTGTECADNYDSDDV